MGLAELILLIAGVIRRKTFQDLGILLQELRFNHRSFLDDAAKQAGKRYSKPRKLDSRFIVILSGLIHYHLSEEDLPEKSSDEIAQFALDTVLRNIFCPEGRPYLWDSFDEVEREVRELLQEQLLLDE
jgi:hypothetical protein